jgi:hypothetical protein
MPENPAMFENMICCGWKTILTPAVQLIKDRHRINRSLIKFVKK